MTKQISFSVPFNGDIGLIDILPSSVNEVYGRLTNDGFWGGRAKYSLKRIVKNDLFDVVSKCNERSIKFNYLLNAPFQGPDQFSANFYRKLDRFLGYLVNKDVWGITTSLPHIAQFSKKHYPSLFVTVSKFARVNTITRLKYWENHGVDRICLDGNLTKRPHTIQHLAAASNVPLVMLCNDACTEDCPFENYHAVYESNHSVKQSAVYLSYFSTFCKLIMAKEKYLILRSTFIRPEDIQTYSNWGVGIFKIVDRNMPTWWITRAVNAYHQGAYDGNLADILNLFSSGLSRQNNNKEEIWTDMSLQKIQVMKKRGALDFPVFIDNAKLDGYILKLERRNCDSRVHCNKCEYCSELANKTIKYGDGYDQFIKNANAVINKY